MTLLPVRLPLALSLVLAAAPAAAMPVRDFLPKAEKLMAMGLRAAFAAERKPVMAEVKRVSATYKADIAAARAAGRTPRSCPPKGAKFDGKDFLAYLRAIPEAGRGMEVTEAFHRYMAARHPC